MIFFFLFHIASNYFEKEYETLIIHNIRINHKQNSKTLFSSVKSMQNKIIFLKFNIVYYKF